MLARSAYSSSLCRPLAADPEDDRVDAALVVVTAVGRAVLAQEVGLVAVPPHGLPQPGDLRPPVVGVVRRIGPIDDHRHSRLAEAREVVRDLAFSAPGQLGVLGREPHIQPGFGKIWD